jgi:hypothetical protein
VPPGRQEIDLTAGSRRADAGRPARLPTSLDVLPSPFIAPLRNIDPAVRSIRIATTLNERFGAILREAASCRDVAEFELRIGEAQQIYPEIWRHLDEARAALAQRGIAVPSYDALRATERPGQLAVDNIEHSEGINPVAIAFGQLLYFETKTATFNHEGHAKAHQACDALTQAMPEVDWRSIVREEDAEIAAMSSLSSAKWRQLAVIAAVVLAAYMAFKLLG